MTCKGDGCIETFSTGMREGVDTGSAGGRRGRDGSDGGMCDISDKRDMVGLAMTGKFANNARLGATDCVLLQPAPLDVNGTPH